MGTLAAVELTAPHVPESGEALMPRAETFREGVIQILSDLLPLLRPDLAEALQICICVFAVVMLCALVCGLRENLKPTANLAAAVGAAGLLLRSSSSLIALGAATVEELTEYGKLLLPVMSAGMAAQGLPGTSAAIYGATAAVSTILGRCIARLFVPMLYVYLALAMASAALGEEMLKGLKELVKKAVNWALKTVLTLYTTYIGITGAVSGTTDAVTLKATKAVISTFVPMVGGILSDASEAVLVGAGLAKNAAGIYGIFAILAVFLDPFLRIGVHCLLLKGTAELCGIFAEKQVTELIRDFSGAMGLLLGMTGAVCLLLLIGTICFLRGWG